MNCDGVHINKKGKEAYKVFLKRFFGYNKKSKNAAGVVNRGVAPQPVSPQPAAAKPQVVESAPATPPKPVVPPTNRDDGKQSCVAPNIPPPPVPAPAYNFRPIPYPGPYPHPQPYQTYDRGLLRNEVQAAIHQFMMSQWPPPPFNYHHGGTG